MSMKYTDEVVRSDAVLFKIPGAESDPIDVVRRRLARYLVGTDPVNAWEVRTGRPWSEMTADEAIELITHHPRLFNNPGVMSRLNNQQRKRND